MHRFLFRTFPAICKTSVYQKSDNRFHLRSTTPKFLNTFSSRATLLFTIFHLPYWFCYLRNLEIWRKHQLLYYAYVDKLPTRQYIFMSHSQKLENRIKTMHRTQNMISAHSEGKSFWMREPIIPKWLRKNCTWNIYTRFSYLIYNLIIRMKIYVETLKYQIVQSKFNILQVYSSD